MNKRVLIFGGGGFIGSNLANRLKSEGDWVRIVDIKPKLEYFEKEDICDEYICADLREKAEVENAFSGPKFDEAYILCADMGGAKHVFSGLHDADILHNSLLMNLYAAEFAVKYKVGRLFFSSSACFVKDTNVYTKDGVKKIQDVEVGDYVYSHTGQLRKVEKTTSNHYYGDMVEINVYGQGDKINCTGDHKFLNKDNKWISARDLTPLDQLKIPQFTVAQEVHEIVLNMPEENRILAKLMNRTETLADFCRNNDITYAKAYFFEKRGMVNSKFVDPITNFKITPNERFGELIGIFLAEGWVETPTAKGARERVTFAFGDEPELVKRTIDLLVEVFGVPRKKCVISYMKKQKGCKIQIVSKVMGDFFKANCYIRDADVYGAHTKDISPLILSCGEPTFLGIIRGYQAGDGCTHRKGGHIRYVTGSVSKTLVDSLRFIMQSVGVYTSSQVRTQGPGTIQGRTVNLKTAYQTYNVSIESTRRMNQIFGENATTKDVFATYDPEEKAFLVQIKEINKKEQSSEVFNLEVEGDHSYLVYGFATHNCVYPEFNQLDPNNPNCEESTAYPAQPDSSYGLEKLVSEKIYQDYSRNYGLDVRIARFHNIAGPHGCYDGGREKFPAAVIRKTLQSDGEIEIWGPGTQTRSFLFIDECLEAVLRFMRQEPFQGPTNIGSEEKISINDLAKMAIEISGKDIKIRNIDGQEFFDKYGFKCPIGVNGRNSDNRLYREKMGWEPTKTLREGMEKTYAWIKSEMEKS